MQRIKSLSWAVVAIFSAVTMTAAPARADRSYSDITGTNIWNSTAPILGTDGKPDTELLNSITQFNQDSEAAFRACDAAIAALEENAGERRFSRQPQAAPEVPEACVRLEELRQQALSLETRLQEAQTLRANPAFRTW